MEFVIETANLTKMYNGLTAVDSLNISVREGEIFGLLGPNGAGKTSTLSMLSTILKPTSGTATVYGFDILKQSQQVRKSIGVVFQEPSLDEKLTGRENLEMHASLYKVPRGVRKMRINDVLSLIELTDRADHLVKTYSGGMKRRLEIARALIHYPKILFLDEPTLGLDPQTREHVWQYIKQLAAKEKVTIILTTHYMDEADLLCNRIAVIDYGKIIALDTPSNLKNSLGGDSIILYVLDVEKAASIFPNCKKFANRIIVPVKNAEKEIGKIFRIAIKNELQILEANIHKPSLNDVFLNLTGREIREEKMNNGK